MLPLPLWTREWNHCRVTFCSQAPITPLWCKAWERQLCPELFLRKELVRGDYNKYYLHILRLTQYLLHKDITGSFEKKIKTNVSREWKSSEECVKRVKIIRAHFLLCPSSNRVWSQGSSQTVEKMWAPAAFLADTLCYSQVCWAFLPPPYTSHLSLVCKCTWTLLSWKCIQACDRIPKNSCLWCLFNMTKAGFSPYLDSSKFTCKCFCRSH